MTAAFQAGPLRQAALRQFQGVSSLEWQDLEFCSHRLKHAGENHKNNTLKIGTKRGGERGTFKNFKAGFGGTKWDGTFPSHVDTIIEADGKSFTKRGVPS